MEKVKDPCVQICQYDHKDICIGCKRTKSEAKAWWRMSEEKKLQVLENVKKRYHDNTDFYDNYV